MAHGGTRLPLAVIVYSYPEVHDRGICHEIERWQSLMETMNIHL